jgi:transposase
VPNDPKVHITFTVDASEAARQLAETRDKLAAVIERAKTAARELHGAGVSESEIARRLGVDRMTIRSWLGKGPGKGWRTDLHGPRPS